MIASFFHTTIYVPLYNGLVFLVDVIPTHDIGLAIIFLTIMVRFILFPLSKRAVETQMKMKKIAPEVDKLKEKFKDDRAEQGRAIFALYKDNGIHPFAGIALLLFQLPVLIGLYWVFAEGGLPAVDSSLLYSFVSVPEKVNMIFLGIADMAANHNIVLAVLASVTQLIYARLSMGPKQDHPEAGTSFAADMAKSMDIQARYVLPVMIGAIAYWASAAAALYWVTGNLFMIAQEYLSGRRFNNES